MHNSKFSKTVTELVQLFKLGRKELTKRRELWQKIVNEIIVPTLETGIKAVYETGGIDIYHKEYKYRENLSVVQCWLGQEPTGISEETDKRSASDVEHGGVLCFSQGPLGEIVILMYPRESEYIKPSDHFLIYKIFHKPEKISKKDVEKALLMLLHYSLSTSSRRVSNFKTRLAVFRLRTADWCFRNSILKTLGKELWGIVKSKMRNI